MELKLSPLLHEEIMVLHGLNRTLWNWNASSCRGSHKGPWVLIVLYGIETLSCLSRKVFLHGLNRTLWNWNKESIYLHTDKRKVLIVLYGIETSYFLLLLIRGGVLIVLYGIETPENMIRLREKLRLNRTLWNWNGWTWIQGCSLYWGLNRTLWNWNFLER